MSSPLPPEGPRENVLAVTATIAIPRGELDVRTSRAGGAGGQHVNTSSTRVELRWNVQRSAILSDATRAALLGRLASRIDGEGFVRVIASERRSQLQNRERAEERLVELLQRALAIPRARRKTKPTRASKEKRLQAKKRNSERKKQRKADDHA